VNHVRKKRFKFTTWGIPLSYAFIAVLVGMTFPRLEHYLLPDLVSTISVSAAMSVCSTIASGMIALTGIVFSLVFLMIQFSATAYSPRLVLWVARDSVVSHALGVFISTFLYALILLAWVDRNATGRVPLMSTFMVLVLLLASMGMFVALIERIGFLQVNRMLVFTGDQGRKAIEDLYPLAEPAPAKAPPAQPADLTPTQTVIHTGHPQVIQAVHMDALATIAKEADAVIEVVATVGDTVLEKSPLLRVYSSRQRIPEALLKSGISIGDERTFEQDPKYALRILVDIAIKALSPAINDPTTAVQALDHIEDLLIRLGCRHLQVGNHADDQGTLRLIVHFPVWEDFLRLALDEIRFCGANSVQVMRRMNALLKNLKEILPVERHTALRHWEERLRDTVQRTFSDAEEKEDASVADRQGLGIGEEKTVKN
jgi:uncharacterized membrane protein